MTDAYISCTPVGTAGMRCISGLTAYDERLIDGRLIGRYCNPCGQVMPEMHLPDAFFRQDVSGVFGITVRGQQLSSGWCHQATECTADSAAMILRHCRIPLQVTVHTTGDGKGWITRWLQIRNLGDRALPLDSVIPFSGRIWRHRFENAQANLRYSPAECGIP